MNFNIRKCMYYIKQKRHLQFRIPTLSKFFQVKTPFDEFFNTKDCNVKSITPSDWSEQVSSLM